MLETGSRLGPYEVVGLIANGGVADVYSARDTRLDRTVALKVLMPGITDANSLASFEGDARTTALLNHPNIVAVYDVGSHGGMTFVASELLEGDTLRTRLRDGALPVKVAMTYAIDIAHGLVAAHDVGIVHRDLNPENIFITREGRAKIHDFGLANCRNETLDSPRQHASSCGTSLGTVAYMSPEQLRDAATDVRSDIFCLGIIMHEMVTGLTPFHADSAAGTQHAILNGKTPALPNPHGLIPGELEHVIRHCLEKDPDERFQSARDLAFVLGIALRSRRQRTQPPPPESRGLLATLFEML